MRNASARTLLLFALCLALALSSLGAAPAAPAQGGQGSALSGLNQRPARLPQPQAGNLLRNPGFENPYSKQCCQPEGPYPPGTPIDEVQVADGWFGWWLEPDANHPGSCDTPGCTAWHRPEFRDANCGPVCANRVRSGSNAQKYFTFHSVHDAGMYQQVGGITPGARLRFSIYMHAWSSPVHSETSSGQASMNMRVGIDPFGGTNPFSPNIVWSQPFDTYDVWGLYTVEAVARSSTVTVFTRSAPVWPLQHNDVYVDDASLIVVGSGGGDGGGGGQQPPAAQPTASPVTGFFYTVVPGDHYYKIARRFGISVQALLAANPTATPNILRVGTVLLIPGVSAPPGGGPLPPPPPQATPAPTVPPTPTLSPAEIPGAFQYVVQRGDNLFRLARRFNTTVARIKQINGLVGDVIYIGQVLWIAPP